MDSIISEFISKINDYQRQNSLNEMEAYIVSELRSIIDIYLNTNKI